MGLHWPVAFAYNDQGVYLSNWPGDNFITWANLQKAWDSGLLRTFDMSGRLMVPYR